ncbi:MAG TPA: ribonuclease P protein component [Paludibacteraceae bacterium]|jgi:ribonuclease P protein component|nr:ribonuclease P protein component [Paludibacteraceae bacterium]MBP9017749.1 ribonuclease P protein component [Paludibacteraceae bacterium]MDS1031204.1 ribonuclease P protein component [Porphyromonadaceae sp. NP-X]HOH55517.1 ribonuclease P protein component [Paludibacteraceae bacterium]HRS24517.1 ribonuclease P protein component [Paludibacteraceae bacterium]
MNRTRFLFPKSERLNSKIKIDRLFTDGKAFLVYPLRTVYFISSENPSELEVLISVPKKKFKKAVHRNRIKRLIREAYRLNKNELCNVVISGNLQMQVAFVYVADKELNFHELNDKMKQILDQLKKIASEQ